jgi:ribosomal protein S6
MAKKKELELENVDLDTEANDAEPRVYELGFHIDPELPTEEVKKVYQGLRDAVVAAGTVVAEGEPENIPLAYTISRSETGGRRDWNSAFFAWIAYEAKGEGHRAVVSKASEEKRLVRFIDVRTTADAARHSADLRAIRMQMPQKEEGISEAEIDAALEAAVI